MASAVQLRYGGRVCFLHELGCSCGDNHPFSFGPEGKTCLLSTSDANTETTFWQIWHRTGTWSMRDGLNKLMDRAGGALPEREKP